MSSERRSTGKRQRFEIFKRDHFTCQYCGKQPPDVVLVVDHITPVCEGGDTSPENLITACETCNQGKAGVLLGQVPVRPDADLMYLELQQELGELRRYQAVKKERDSIMADIIADLQATWMHIIGQNWTPEETTLRAMLDRYEPAIVDAALRVVAHKIHNRTLRWGDSSWQPYMWATMKNMAKEQHGEE